MNETPRQGRRELAHALRNPLAAADANLRFLSEICDDLERAVRSVSDDGAPAGWQKLRPPRLLKEAREALLDSVQALDQIKVRLAQWTDDGDARS